MVLRVIQDEDRDGIYYASDNCPSGISGWISNLSTDIDGDGCRDATEDDDDDKFGKTLIAKEEKSYENLNSLSEAKDTVSRWYDDTASWPGQIPV